VPKKWSLRFRVAVAHDPQDIQFRSAAAALLAGEFNPLIDYERLGKDAALSIPTPDHYLPLLCVLAARQQGESVKFPVEGIDGGSVSMLTVQIG